MQKKDCEVYIPCGIVLLQEEQKKLNAFSGSFRASEFVQTTYNKNREPEIVHDECRR